MIVEGTGRISVRASDSVGDVRTVATVRVEGAQHEQVQLRARIDRFVDGGAMWLEACTSAAALGRTLTVIANARKLDQVRIRLLPGLT